MASSHLNLEVVVKRLFAPMLLAAIAGAAVALVAVLTLGSDARQRSTPTARTTSASSPSGASTGTRREVASTALTATQIYQRDSSGVVSIKAVTSEGEDSGTGIVLNDEGLILTNDHVVAGASEHRGRPGQVLERDPRRDARRRGSQRGPRADQDRSVGPGPASR